MSITVSDFLTAMKRTLKDDPTLSNATLSGEISNFKAHQSGHFYFSIKDSNASISCVMFRSSAIKVPFRPKDGDHISLTGSVDIYEGRGQLQLNVTHMSLDGAGALYLEFEKLKKHYHSLGYFNEDHKKDIPLYPFSIAVISGKDSAAHADITRTLKERWPQAIVYDLFAYVQGQQAAPSIIEAIHHAHELAVETIILARGGGSIEDLWAFNEPNVVESIYQSTIPIITGVGHEVDVTLSDYVSDYRAATPTAAAVKAVPLATEIEHKIRSQMNQMYVSIRTNFKQRVHLLATTQTTRVFSNPYYLIEKRQQTLDYQNMALERRTEIFRRMSKHIDRNVELLNQRLLLALRDQTSSIEQLKYHLIESTQRKLHMQDMQSSHYKAYFDNESRHILAKSAQNTEFVRRVSSQNLRQLRRLVSLNQLRFEGIIKTLDQQSPLAKMQRGFAFVSHNQEPIKSAKAVHIDDKLELRFSDGIVYTKVEKKEIIDDE